MPKSPRCATTEEERYAVIQHMRIVRDLLKAGPATTAEIAQAIGRSQRTAIRVMNKMRVEFASREFNIVHHKPPGSKRLKWELLDHLNHAGRRKRE